VGLALRNLLFTVVMPGTIGVYVPWLILAGDATFPDAQLWPAVVLVVVGLALYVWCLWLFAVRGRGTPGPWDAPRRFVAVGPYRWVRNPMYLGVLLVVAGEALVFLSAPLLVWLVVVALAMHLFTVGYEEPALTERFGGEYLEYRRRVPRWLPRRPSSRGP
jgi:protein-S-isoprenylcysteine O-methyltransferase Ste14